MPHRRDQARRRGARAVQFGGRNKSVQGPFDVVGTVPQLRVEIPHGNGGSQSPADRQAWGAMRIIVLANRGFILYRTRQSRQTQSVAVRAACCRWGETI